MDQRRSREDQLAEELQGLAKASEDVPEIEAESNDQEAALPAAPDESDSAAESEAAAS